MDQPMRGANGASQRSNAAWRSASCQITGGGAAALSREGSLG